MFLQPDEFFEYEADLEKKACKRARTRGWYCRKYKSSPGNRSAPDRILVRRKVVLFVEFKRTNAVPTELQMDEIRDLQAHGANVVWVDSIEDFEAVLSAYEGSA